MIGQTLSHYVIEGSLGAGGMGAVYLARDLALGRPAAIKVVADSFDRSLRERLLREAEASARLQHPGIATFYEPGETESGVFIAMEYVHGRTLRDRLARGRLRSDEVVEIACAVLEALNHAHAAGILHRDIKPENIMVTDEGAAEASRFRPRPQLSGLASLHAMRFTFTTDPNELEKAAPARVCLGCGSSSSRPWRVSRVPAKVKDGSRRRDGSSSPATASTSRSCGPAPTRPR